VDVNAVHYSSFLKLAALGVFLTMCCGLQAPPSWAATYHVDVKTGRDSNPGARSSPFKTIKRASEVLTPGDRALIHEGVYHEQILGGRSGMRGAPIVYEGVHPDKVILQGSVKVDDWKKRGEVWVKAGLAPITHVNSFVMVDEKLMLRKADSPVNMQEMSYHLDKRGTFTIRLPREYDPNQNRKVEVYELDVAFNSGDRWGGTAKSWIVLRNLTFEKYGAHPISTDAGDPSGNAHWELDGLTVRYNNNEGVFHCLDDWRVHDCKFIRNRGHGCQINGARVRFINNVSAENEWFGPTPNGGCGLLIGPDKTAHSCVVRNNVLSKNGHRLGYGCGIYLEGRSHGNLVEANRIVENTHGGVGFYGSSHNKVMNNILVNIAPNLNQDFIAAFVVAHSYEGAPTQSVGNLVAHNTVWGCPSPVAVFTPRRQVERSQLNRFVNNLFAHCRFISAIPSLPAISLKGNGWFACPETGDWSVLKMKILLRTILGQFEYRGPATLDEKCVIGTDSGLRNPSRGDYGLRPDSPLIDVGVLVKETQRDVQGTRRPCGKAPDIGAYEYSPSPRSRGNRVP